MNLWFDVKYAWRLMFKTPGHSLLCIVVVALSVGLAMWSYELAYSQAFKPIGFPGSDRWYSLQVAANATATPKPNLDAYTYQEILKRSRTVNFLGAFSSESAVLSEGQASTSLRAAAISPELLAAMQIAPQMGRLFGAADSSPGAAQVVILAFDTWQSYFAADPAVVGKTIRIDGQPVQIVGVMPDDKNFYTFQDFEIWRPLQLKNLAQPRDSAMTLSAIVVLDKDQDADAVMNEAKPAVDEVNRNYPQLFDSGRHVALIPGHRMSSHQLMEMVATVGFTAVAVLLLGCTNISLIFFARQLERSRELALRTALGSSRSRLLRQCLLETALVVLVGMLGGVGLAVMGLHWAHGLGAFASRIQAEGRALNVPVLRVGDLLAAAIAATVIWLLSTLIPAWRIAKQDAALVLAGSRGSVAVNGGSKSAGALVGLQVVISCLVLVICGSIVLAARAELNKPAGLNTAQVMLSTYPTVFAARYSEATERLRYWDELTAEIKARMSDAEVAYSNAVPSRPRSTPVAIELQEGLTHQGTLTMPLAAVSDNYFHLLGVSLRSGRLFDSTDNSSSQSVVIVDENAAKRYWPDENALGQRIQLNPPENAEWLTVVGIVSAVRRPYDRERGVVYQPLRQALPGEFHVLVKLPTAATNSRAALQAAAFAVDRDLPLHNLQMLAESLEALNLMASSLVPSFSAIATITLFLAATGLFGLISRSVAARTQEVGVRRALGSTQWQVTAVFLRQGALYASVGVVGVCLGIIVATLISASIPNILTHVLPVTFGVLVLMALVIFVASYLPTRRAVALEPGDALHYE